jgi:hypothetical protein
MSGIARNVTIKTKATGRLMKEINMYLGEESKCECECDDV